MDEEDIEGEGGGADGWWGDIGEGGIGGAGIKEEEEDGEEDEDPGGGERAIEDGEDAGEGEADGDA